MHSGGGGGGGREEEEEEAHCALKSPAAFIKTGLRAEANDPREINDSIK